MDLDKKLKKQHVLLERLHDELAASELPCVINVEKIPGTDKEVEICRFLLDDLTFDDDPMMAEFFFLNTDYSAPDLIYFSAMITLREELRLGQSMQLMELLTMLNQCMPFGAFKLDVNSGLLTYRLDGVYNATLDDDAIYPHITATAANMLNASHMFSPIVLEVCNEEITVYEAMKTLKLGSFAEG